MSDLTFRILEEGHEPREIPIADGMTIGRHPDSTCALNDPRVSGRHAHVVSKDGALHYEHIGSSNQTKASSGAQLGHGEAVELTAGLELTLGGTSIQVVGPGAMPATRVDMAAQEEDEPAIDVTVLGKAGSAGDVTKSIEQSPVSSEAESSAPAEAEAPKEEPAAAEKPAAEKPAAEKPAAEKPAAEAPAAEAPAAEKPAAEKPAAEKPAAEKPAAEKPAAEKPAAEKPAAEKPAAEKPAAEKPAAEKPAAAAKAESKGEAEKEAEAMPAAAPSPGDIEEDLGGQTMVTMAAGSGDTGLTDIAKLAKFQDIKPRLGIHSDADALRGVHDVDSLEFTVGRSERRKPELRVDHEGVSGEHATISFDGRRFRISDRNSTNGTRVNDEALPAGGSKELLNCDIWLSFGPIDALFVVDKDHQARGPQAGLYDRAVDTLVQQNKITTAQSEEAKAHARGLHGHVGLALTCAMGVISPRDWMESLELARIQILSGSKGGGGAGGGNKALWVGLVLAAVVAAAVFVLI